MHMEALVTVDRRGQIVVPKAVRKKTGINDGEKLVLLTSQKEGEPCYIFLIKTGNLTKKARSPVHDESEISTK
jgi:AbrB family looped-hinge helix DNA binding protein